MIYHAYCKGRVGYLAVESVTEGVGPSVLYIGTLLTTALAVRNY